MAEIKVTPQQSISYIDTTSTKKVEAAISIPFVCVSYIGDSVPADVQADAKRV